MSDFADLKLPTELVERLSELGYRQPSALQAEAVPVIARGTSAVGTASAGSGKTLAYALGLAARLDPSAPGTQALILRPTDHAAERTADTLHSLLGRGALSVGVVRPTDPAKMHVACCSPATALDALEHSTVKLDGLVSLIIDGASAMQELGATDALETLAAHVPKDAQRVVLTSQPTQEIEDWADRHARRARRLVYLPTEADPLPNASLEFWAAPRQEWLPALVRLLSDLVARTATGIWVHCRLQDEARKLADRLQVRGFQVGESADGAGVQVTWGSRPQTLPAELAIAWGTPLDFPAFRAHFEVAKRTVIFAEPRELAHLARLVEIAAVRVSALRTSAPPHALDSAETTRERLRQAAGSRDLEPYMLLLEPLLDEFTPTQIAAAAAALLRERAPQPRERPLPAWTRLYFGVGRRDGVRPADLVGAITGEASVTGDRIGRIEIRDTHSSVEVAASVADRVRKALAAATIRGRPAAVRVFRE